MKARLQLLADASSTFAEAALDPDRLLATIARRITEAIGDSCGIRLLDEGSPTLRHVAFFHRDPEAQAAITRMFEEVPLRLGEGVLGSAAQSQRSLLVPRLDQAQMIASTKPEYRPIVERYPAHTLMVIPLKSRGQPLGVLGMARYETAAPYGEEDLRLGEDLADRAAMAIEVARLLARERAGVQRALAVANASIAIQTLDHNHAVASIARTAADLIGDSCVVTLRQEGQLLTKVAVHRNPDAEQLLQGLVGRPVPDSASLVVRVYQENRAIRLEDARDYQPVVAGAEEYRKDFGIDSLLVCPLRVGNGVIGTLGLSRTAGGAPYTQSDELFLQDLADRAALVIHNAQLYESAESARRQAEKASALKDEFLSTASHELRTPITTLQLMVQSILRKLGKTGSAPVDPQVVVPRLQMVDLQVRRLVALTDNLLDVSRISAGRLQLSPESLDLVELARAVVSRLHEHAVERGQCLTLVATEPVPGCWDRERLDQVITNLVTNAIKYGERRPVTVTITGEPARARMVVADSGIGIAPEQQARIFERFERAESARNFGGFGVGLWIVKEVVQAMDGQVAVQSQLGEGATFTVTLPR
jgi:signal transduction histidine kinase